MRTLIPVCAMLLLTSSAFGGEEITIDVTFSRMKELVVDTAEHQVIAC